MLVNASGWASIKIVCPIFNDPQLPTSYIFADAFGSYVLSFQSPLFTEKMRRGVESYFVELFFPAIYFIEDHKRLDVSMRSGQVKLQ